MVYQLIYVSTPQEDLSIAEAEQIVEKSRLSNSHKSITGFLCGNSSYFIQCLEGDEQLVKNLFSLINQDQRHHTVKVIVEEERDQRSFSQWSMGVILGMEKHQNILCRYRQEGVFDPYRLSGSDALDMLKAFAELRRL